MNIHDPFVRWISDDNGAPVGFQQEDGSCRSIVTYPDTPDDPYSGIAYGALEVRHQAASYSITDTPTVITPDTVVTEEGIVSWDAVNGIITVHEQGVFDFLLMANASSANNRTLYFHAELDTGSGFELARWTARQSKIIGNTAHQTVFVSTNRFTKGTSIKVFLWASVADVSVSSEDLPGYAGQLTVPALRLMFSGAR